MSFLRREQMDCCNYVEAMGSKILVNSKSNWMHLESLEGNTTQVQTTGAQLFDIKNIVSPQTVNGITLTTDLTNGTITVNGTATAVTIFTIPLTNIIPTGKIIYMGANNPIAGNSELQLRLMTEDESVIVVGLQLLTIDTSIVTTLTNDVSKIGFRIGANQTVNNFVIKIMLAYDSAKPWEPYTGGKPSPSPQYLQDIKGIGESGNINIIVAGTQLFDIDSIITSNNVYIDENNTEIVVNDWARNIGISCIASLKPATTYRIKATIRMIQVVNDESYTSNKMKRLALYRNSSSAQGGLNILLINNGTIMTNGQEIEINNTFTTPESFEDCELLIYSERYTKTNNPDKYSQIGFKDIMITETETDLVWEPYYSPQNISITLTKPLYGIDNYNDEIAVTKRIDKCIELTFDGSEYWDFHNLQQGFYTVNALPNASSFRKGYCNQFIVISKLNNNPNGLILGMDNNRNIYTRNNQFYDSTIPDKGLAAWKAHLSTNPLKIVTYTNPEGYVETPLEQSNIDAIKSLYAYNGYTIVNNNENTNMKIMYKTKS